MVMEEILAEAAGHQVPVCHPVSYFMGSLGVVGAIVFANLGAAYGRAAVCNIGGGAS